MRNCILAITLILVAVVASAQPPASPVAGSWEGAIETGALIAPMLAVGGELDLQVLPDQNLPAIEAALKQGGNADATVARLPGLNHLFQTAKADTPAEYAQIEETLTPAALDTISAWIRKRTGLAK